MQKEHISRIRRPGRILSDAVTALLILLILYAALTEAFAGPVQRVRRIARRSVYYACAAAAYTTARYDAETITELMQLDEDDKTVGVLTATSRLNTLSPLETLSTCARYRRLLGTLINDASLTVSETTLAPVNGGAAQVCTRYTIMPTEAQMTTFIRTLANNMETDGGLFVLSRAFYTALMMVAQDATEVMAINAFENAWKSLSGADEAHIEETAARLLANNFPITFVADGDRVGRLDADFNFADSRVRLAYDSAGKLADERMDVIVLLVDNTEMRIENTVSLAPGEGLSGELTTHDGGETNVLPYGRTRVGGT